MGLVVATTRVACNTSTGNQTITTSELGGLTPKAAIFIASYATTDGTLANHAVISYGITDGVANDYTLMAHAKDGANPTYCRRGSDTNAVVRIWNPGTILGTKGVADFANWETNGVTINWTTAAASGYLLNVIFFAGDTLSVHVGYDTTSSSGKDYTSAGFAFDAGFFFTPGRPHTTGGNTDVALGIGVCDGSANQRSVVLYGKHNTTPTQWAGATRDDYAIGAGSSSGLGWGVTISDIDSSGFTHTCTSSPFDDLFFLLLNTGTSTKVGSMATPSGTGNNSVTGVGFSPQAVIHLQSLFPALNTNYTDRGGIGIGVVTKNNTYSTCVMMQDNVSTSKTRSLSDDRLTMYNNASTTTAIAATLVSFDSDGWTYNYTKASTRRWPYIAFKGDSVSMPLTKELTLTKYTPQSAQLAEPSSNAITIDGLLPFTGRYAFPDTRVSYLYGYEPQILSEQISEPQTEELTLTGYAVDSSQLPLTGEIQLSGYTPEILYTLPRLTNLAVTAVASATAGGSQTITADLAGETPKAVIFIGCNGITDAVAADDYIMTYGFTDGSRSYCLSNTDKDNVNPSANRRTGYVDRCVQFHNPGAVGDYGRAVFSSFSANSVTINWVTAPNAPYIITTVFITGSTLSAYVGYTSTTGLNKTATYSTAPFAFDAGIFLTPARRVGAGTDGILSSIGFCDNNLNQASIAMRTDDNISPTSSWGGIRNDSCVAVTNRSGWRWYEQITGITSTGFRHVTRLNAPGDDIMFLLLDYGKQTKVGVYSAPTATGDYSVSGVGFKPEMLLSIFTMFTTVNTQSGGSDPATYAYGVTTPNKQYCTAFATEENIATANTKALNDARSVNLLTHTGTQAFKGQLVSMLNDGFKINYETVDTAGARKFIYLALQGEIEVSQSLSGQVKLTGHKPTITDPTKIKLNVPAGSISLTGYVPDTQLRVQPKTQQLRFTSMLPTLIPIVVSTDQVLIAGHVPDVLVPTQKTNTAILTLRGYPPNWPGQPIDTLTTSAKITGHRPTIVSTNYAPGFFWTRIPDTRTQ